MAYSVNAPSMVFLKKMIRLKFQLECSLDCLPKSLLNSRVSLPKPQVALQASSLSSTGCLFLFKARFLSRNSEDEQSEEEDSQKKKKQVTRGHNMVADGWAGAANPHPHPTPSQHRVIHRKLQNARFSTFWLVLTNGPMDQRKDGRTDGQSLL